MDGVPSVGGLSRGSYPVCIRVSEKTTENSERRARQAQPKIDPGTSRLPVFERRTTLPMVEAKDGQFDIHALHGIQTHDLWFSSRLS